jgi:hypothetical protein
MISKSFSPAPGYMRLIFELPACLWADHVFLVGDFNAWDPNATPLRQDRMGAWRAVVDLPIGRRYEFRYLIDGRWCTDFHADGTMNAPSGALNSVVDTETPLPLYHPSTGHGLIHEGASDTGVDLLQPQSKSSIARRVSPRSSMRWR